MPIWSFSHAAVGDATGSAGGTLQKASNRLSAVPCAVKLGAYVGTATATVTVTTAFHRASTRRAGWEECYQPG